MSIINDIKFWNGNRIEIGYEITRENWVDGPAGPVKGTLGEADYTISGTVKLNVREILNDFIDLHPANAWSGEGLLTAHLLGLLQKVSTHETLRSVYRELMLELDNTSSLYFQVRDWEKSMLDGLA